MWLIESASLVGTKCANALNGTGVCSAELLVLLDPPPPPPPDELPVEVDRDVPLTDVVALEEVEVPVLVVESTVELVPVVDAEDSAELEFTGDAADVDVVLPDANADVDDDAEETPLVDADGVSSDVLDPPEADPAPDDDPAELDGVGPTVPAVVACT
jgi:hypothetical protein